MLESGKITPLQAMFLMILTVLGTANLTMPAIVAGYAGLDAWLTPILAFFPHMALIFVISKIGNTFSQENFAQYINKITGKYLGISLALGYLWYQMFSTALITRTVSEFLITCFMSETSVEVFIIVLILVTALAVRAGLEVLARAASFILPIFIISFMIILSVLIQEMDFTKITPILESDFKPVIYGAINPSLWRGEFFLMLFIWPHLNKPDQGLRSMLQAAIIIVLVMLPLTVATTTIFGPLTPRMRFPTFSLVEFIDLGGFMARLDAIFMAVWIAGVFVKIGIYYYVFCLFLGEFLGLKEYKCVVFPAGIIQGVLVITIASNVVTFENLFPTVVVPLDILFEYIIPFGLLGLIYLRGLHKGKHQSK